MKKNLCTFLCIFPFFINAQIPVTDAAANGQLGTINYLLTQLNSSLSQQNSTSRENKIENYKQRLLGKDNFNFIKQVEDYMWKADEYLKKGREIQMVYNKEEDILKKLQTIKRNSSKFQFEGSQSYINEINRNISSTLGQIGSLVDEAQYVLGDKNTRMSTEGRRDVIKETLSKLFIIERSLDNILLKGQMQSIQHKQFAREEEYQNDVRNSMEQFRKFNAKNTR